jgi:hypothetical protein
LGHRRDNLVNTQGKPCGWGSCAACAAISDSDGQVDAGTSRRKGCNGIGDEFGTHAPGICDGASFHLG